MLNRSNPNLNKTRLNINVTITIFILPDLTDVVRGLAHLEGAGGGLAAVRREVGVVDGGGAPAPASQGAAHTKPTGAGPGGRAAWGESQTF